jgi:hypothetical protein
MGYRRVAALGVAGCLALAGAACGPARQDAPAAPSGGSDAARAAVAEAYERSLSVSHTIEAVAAGFTSRTALDPATARGVLSVRRTFTDGTELTADVRRIGPDTWISATGVDGVDADTWIHVESERTAGTMVAIDTDEIGEGITGSLILVRGAAPLYSGTLMVTGVRAARLGLAGTAATLTPFTATIDERGRLTSMTLEANAPVGLDATRTTISGFEAPVSVAAPPAADVVEGTDGMLAAFGIN